MSQRKHLYRSRHNVMLGGVCGGLGEYFTIDPIWLRIAWIAFAFASLGFAILIYIALWLILAADPSDFEPLHYRQVYRSADNRVIAGVCGGLGEYFNIDPLFLRIGFVAILFVGGLGILVYLLLWFMTPLIAKIGLE